MTQARRFTLIATLSATLALTGCTTVSAGSPMPGDTISTTPDTAESTATEPSSERPRDIDLTGKDPCGQIPQADWPKFGIDGPGKPSEHPDFKSPQCYYSSARAGNVALVVTAGIEEWTTIKYNVEIEDVEPIDGYPTLTVASNIDRRACWAVVDVADGQSLMTTATPDPNEPGSPERCDLAYQLAESAMKTLVAS
ncbi:DUF3558 domain-containing protein [Actinophytocola glycyrrhizae]|uniref:DUF3558 domain-containing protein n=1 Tax=Actinophytocola glycyrrhizae TaxID=2044873 RepID=A0ABV9S7A8_9PSEU